MPQFLIPFPTLRRRSPTSQVSRLSCFAAFACTMSAQYVNVATDLAERIPPQCPRFQLGSTCCARAASTAVFYGIIAAVERRCLMELSGLRDEPYFAHSSNFAWLTKRSHYARNRKNVLCRGLCSTSRHSYGRFLG